MSERAAEWRRLVAAWEASGLSQAEFCRRRGIKTVTFAWWKRRLRQLAESGSAQRRDAGREPRGGHVGSGERPDFVELALPRNVPFAGFAYELALPGGACLRLPADFDPQRVAALAGALMTAGCVGRAVC